MFGNFKSVNGKFQISYVISLPLLCYAVMEQKGEIKINKKKISYQLKLLKDSMLPVVIYLFSNYFSVS
ncbi:hypothetical protein A9G22_05065 [Gilliamella sp. App2-1]|nr:hypothetical protein A9G23_09980 [Gilliamella apicola]OCG24130.1 hypothetical protein A9G22_05065 [Gilliamella apicola]